MEPKVHVPGGGTLRASNAQHDNFRKLRDLYPAVCLIEYENEYEVWNGRTLLATAPLLGDALAEAIHKA